MFVGEHFIYIHTYVYTFIHIYIHAIRRSCFYTSIQIHSYIYTYIYAFDNGSFRKKVGVKGEPPKVNGELHKRVIVDDSFWTLEDGEVVVRLGSHYVLSGYDIP